ncbi:MULTISPECIES: 30S ribosomal protein S1 [Loigolactobacillus]|uniref:30S ribosomal protein S1 n=1 Tax=Loigolactobacillus backii TaxID=375175 RepID=A0A192H229_9LACO|nr:MULTISPECIES: 30S ribosomal protein S1 [Loigolactobacillus]ANK59570.1 30S ribosomal protein S1 [Loigolactobacillus backii]ANK62864.1 30S ribosomal protein S1 [Loigolactobacillus backii]ANK64564.1 30S ribosomal protein S1 [Loigolactobacillus backii]ANK67041.1 30S ribosomal protein S1 [Loigolactobacillus backii]ANK70128.1 30S ribosomal protein S1 [Loigolactobacillus backii]
MSENNNTNENKNAMADALNSVHDVKIGDIVKGEVLAIDDDKQLIVGIQGTGVEGVVPLKELASQPVDDIKDIAKVGDVLDLVVISTIGKDKENGSYLLSKRRLEARKVWADIQKEFEAGNTLTATVTEVVKGGLVVDAGVRGFIPASMISDHFVDDLSQYKGQELELKIIEIEPSENRLILSHRAIVEAQKAEQREKILATIKAGDTVEGTVARLTNFGAFVDLGGIDGLVHVSEISYERVAKPSDVLKVGQQLKVKVLAVDPEKNRISLSLKALLPEPWDGIEDKAPAGTVLEGTVKRLTTFGAFVEVFPGVEGLVHISQISHEHIATPNEVLSEGETIKVKVLEVKPEAHRLALSIKALTPKPNTDDKTNTASPAETSNYQSNDDEGGFTLGDLIGNELKKSTSNNDDDKN